MTVDKDYVYTYSYVFIITRLWRGVLCKTNISVDTDAKQINWQNINFIISEVDVFTAFELL